jgi:probable F420-dependent oxidoreductase
VKLGIATAPTDQSIHPSALGEALEARGFESLMVAEHSHIPVSRATPYPGGGDLPSEFYRVHDPFIALTAAATATSELLLGTSVLLLPQRDAIQTAKAVASIDQISNGRFLLGIGLGWNLEEAGNHGVASGMRGRLLDEKLAAMKELWANDEAEFHGRLIDFDPTYCWPKPVQRPHPRIYLGGFSMATVARARRHGAGWMPLAAETLDMASAQMRLLDDGASDVPVTVVVPAGNAQPALLDAYRWYGAERAIIAIAPEPEAETLKRLDDLAPLVEMFC